MAALKRLPNTRLIFIRTVNVILWCIAAAPLICTVLPYLFALHIVHVSHHWPNLDTDHMSYFVPDTPIYNRLFDIAGGMFIYGVLLSPAWAIPTVLVFTLEEYRNRGRFVVFVLSLALAWAGVFLIKTVYVMCSWYFLP